MDALQQYLTGAALGAKILASDACEAGERERREKRLDDIDRYETGEARYTPAREPMHFGGVRDGALQEP